MLAPRASTLCMPGYLPSCARFTPLMMGSKQIKSRVCPGGAPGNQIVATLYFGPNSVSSFLLPASIQEWARPSASR